MEGVVGLFTLLERMLAAIDGAFSQLARRPALWAGSFSYLFPITAVRHLSCATYLDRTELTAYAATYLVFKKASAFVCVAVLG